MGSLQERLERFRSQDAERDVFLQELIEENQQLKKDLQSAKCDYVDQLESRRNWQERATTVEKELSETVGNSSGDPFVLVLIDGDGYFFQESLLERGADGGAEAAQRMLNTVQQYISKFNGAGDWQVLVRVFLNIDFLTRKCKSEGVVRDELTLRQFALGFTKSQPLFEIIDAGQGKDRVDYKVKGYASLLEPHRVNDALISRVTLVEPSRLGWQYKDLPFPSMKMNSNIFRDPGHIVGRQATPKAMNVASPSSTRSSSVSGSNCSTPRDPLTSPNRPLYPVDIVLNKDNERLDGKIGEQNVMASESVKRRLTEQNVCFSFHLKGKCMARRCPSSHDRTFSQDEVIALGKVSKFHGKDLRQPRTWAGKLEPRGRKFHESKYEHELRVLNEEPLVEFEKGQMPIETDRYPVLKPSVVTVTERPMPQKTPAVLVPQKD
ncbi:hypothetical protein G7Y79_00040g076720 [Physcia stellaris]|nr:hypothetical protein G7Y79_00040g076720 [Physcia stellaris]